MLGGKPDHSTLYRECDGRKSGCIKDKIMMEASVKTSCVFKNKDMSIFEFLRARREKTCGDLDYNI